MILRYKLKEFDAAAEQFFPEEGKSLPQNAISIGGGCWYLRGKTSWTQSDIDFEHQILVPGDWIVRTNRGEIYRISNEDFRVTFERIT